MDASPGPLMLVVSIILIFLFFLAILVLQFKRCPSNRVLVVYGKIAGERAARCIHGGGTFVVPLLQSYAYMSLEPMTIDIELTSALSLKNIRVNVPSTFTVGIATVPEIMNNAAERLLGLDDHQIASQAQDIILGQMRLVIATLSIEEINQDREKFLDLVNKNVNFELNKIGLEMINVNIRDITDESGYIEALGQRAASEAVNRARVEVADADREGAIGSATAKREMDVEVAQQDAQSVSGIKQTERDQRIQVAKFEAEGIASEAESARRQAVAVAEQNALTAEGQKKAEAHQRVEIAEFEAAAIKGENESRAKMAAYNAELAEREAEARRRGDVALAESARDVLRAQREEETARLEKEQIAQQTVERQKVEIEAGAEAERLRLIARGEADAILARYEAEANGLRQVLEAKAAGYERLMAVCGERPDLAPALLIVEQLPALVAEQVKAIQNLKIDKITVWDSGDGGGNSTAGFLKGLIGSLPPIHELARQAGIELPAVLGQVSETSSMRAPPAEDAAAAEETAAKDPARNDAKSI